MPYCAPRRFRRAGAVAALDQIVEVDARDANRRREARRAARTRHRGERREREQPPARLRLDDEPTELDGMAASRHDVHAPEREHEAEHETRRAEQRALEHEVHDDVAPRRAERGARRELGAARDAARELQVRDVRARHEQHGEHSADERDVKWPAAELSSPDGGADLHAIVAQRLARPASAIRCAEHGQLGFGDVRRVTPGFTRTMSNRDRREIDARGGKNPRRRVAARIGRAIEHTDDRVRVALNRQLAADRAVDLRKEIADEPFADDDGRRGRVAIGLAERASGGRPHARARRNSWARR